MKLLDFEQFLNEADDNSRRNHIVGKLHKQFIEDTKRAVDDIDSEKQTISDKKLKVGDYALHKSKQTLGPGQITKLHPTQHADLHFSTNLKSSLVDGPPDYKTFTFHLDDLIPIVGTSDT